MPDFLGTEYYERAIADTKQRIEFAQQMVVMMSMPNLPHRIATSRDGCITYLTLTGNLPNNAWKDVEKVLGRRVSDWLVGCTISDARFTDQLFKLLNDDLKEFELGLALERDDAIVF